MRASSITKFCTKALCLAVVLSAFELGPASAQQEVPSCYTLVNIDGVKPPELDRELFVLIDQTLHFNDKIKSQVNSKIQSFLREGDLLVLATFSANAEGRYSEVVMRGRLDRNLPDNQRYKTSKAKLTRLDACFQQQEIAVRQLTVDSLNKAFGESTSELPKTEIVGNLVTLSRDIMAVRESEHAVVLIVSDMLENSNITSFYGQRKLRNLDVEVELEKIEKAGMISSFNEAVVYVIGAGFTAKGNYRSAKTLSLLEDFWREYFEKSGGVVKGFGTPALFVPLAD
jgi:hypothetical protein